MNTYKIGGIVFEECENCGAIHKEGTLVNIVDLSREIFKVCRYCRDNWGK